MRRTASSVVVIVAVVALVSTAVVLAQRSSSPRPPIGRAEPGGHSVAAERDDERDGSAQGDRFRSPGDSDRTPPAADDLSPGGRLPPTGAKLCLGDPGRCLPTRWSPCLRAVHCDADGLLCDELTRCPAPPRVCATDTRCEPGPPTLCLTPRSCLPGGRFPLPDRQGPPRG
ncbi:hypothetical protein BH24ACT26_BH24ACT26_16940 [soil metagenome]